MRNVVISPRILLNKNRDLNWLQRNAAKLLLWLWALGAYISSYLLLTYTPDSIFLVILNLSAYFFSAVIFFITRKNIFSPLGIAALLFWIAFLLPLPLFAFFLPKTPLSAPMMVKSLQVALTALLSFLIGYQVHWKFPTRVLSKIVYPHCLFRPLNPFDFLVSLGIVIIAAVLRVLFSVGQVSSQKFKLPYDHLTGIIYYLLTDGQLVIIASMLVFSMSMRVRLFLVISLTSVFTYGIASIMNGWKSGFITPVLMAFFIYWYHTIQPNKQKISLLWIIPLIFILPYMINLGHKYRSVIEYGYAADWSTSYESFFNKFITRSDGTYRLATIIAHETDGGNLSLVNDFKFLSLRQQGISAVNYADRYIWRIPVGVVTSTGTSGPGEWYVNCGLTGVILGYFLLGMLYKSFYSTIINHKNNLLAIALNGYTTVLLVFMWSENSNLLILFKKLIIILPTLWILKQYSLRRVGFKC